MKILNLSKYDFWGAGLAAKSIHNLLLKNGFDSTIIVDEAQKPSVRIVGLHRYPNSISPFYFFKMAQIAKTNYTRQIKFGKTDPKYCFYNFTETQKLISADEILLNVNTKPDVIILHWISNFVNANTIRDLQQKTHALIIWIMMDHAAFTGGCHFAWDCKGYQSNCSDCPAFFRKSARKLPQKNFQNKKEILPSDLKIVAWSESDYQRLNQSSLFSNEQTYKLMIPVDETLFYPGDRNEARNYWRIDKKKKVIMIGAVSPKEKRKGFIHFSHTISLLFQILIDNGIKPDNFEILIAGKKNSKHFKNIKLPLKHTGYLNQQQLVLAYQASDVFVSTSIEDSGPTMVNQAMMCGVPVVAFKIGGAIDLIENRNTGRLSEIGDDISMAKNLFHILNLDELEKEKMHMECYQVALQLVSEKAFIDGFKAILSKKI